MSWVSDLLQLVQSLATLTRDVEWTSNEIKDLRKDINDLTLSVSELMIHLEHQKEKTALVLDSHQREIAHIKEGNAAKFQVLTTMLDQKMDGFESRFADVKSKAPRRRVIESISPAKE
jgi:uncharacterized protein YoxC